jgi:hypothetical protein
MSFETILTILAGLIPLIGAYLNAKLSKDQATKDFAKDASTLQNKPAHDTASVISEAEKEIQEQLNGGAKDESSTPAR